MELGTRSLTLRSRLLSGVGTGAMAFATAMPVSQWTTFPSATAYRAAVSRALLIVPAYTTSVCRCPSGFTDLLSVDLFAVHAHLISCKHGANLNQVHTKLARALERILYEGGCGTIRREEKHLAAGSDRRPGDITSCTLAGNGGRLLVDAVVNYVSSHTGLLLACKSGGAAALKSEEKKLRNLPPLVDPSSSFVPFAVDDWGRMAPLAIKLLSTLSEHGGEHSAGLSDGDEKQVAAHLLHRWRQYISVAIHGTTAQVACARISRSMRARNYTTSYAA